jgi:hypothetical protein
LANNLPGRGRDGSTQVVNKNGPHTPGPCPLVFKDPAFL